MGSTILQPKMGFSIVNDTGNSPPDPPELNPPYITTAVEFDGINDFTQTPSDMAGNADGQKGIVSCWVKIDSTGVGAIQKIYDCTSGKLNIRLTTGGALAIEGSELGTATVLMTMGSALALPFDEWVHILAAWDVSIAVADSQLYINDIKETTPPVTGVATLIDYTRANHSVGSSPSGSQKYKGCISDFYINTVEYLDLDIESNRRKFIDAEVLPVDLGIDNGDEGKLPTGNAPIIFFKGDKTEYFANLGYGGAFPIIGAIDDCADAPSS